MIRGEERSKSWQTNVAGSKENDFQMIKIAKVAANDGFKVSRSQPVVWLLLIAMLTDSDIC